MSEGAALSDCALIEWIDFAMPGKTALKISDYTVRHGVSVTVWPSRSKRFT